jgi:hypothetical protein
MLHRSTFLAGAVLLAAGGAVFAQRPTLPPSQAPLKGLFNQGRGRVVAVNPKAGTVTIRPSDDPRVAPVEYRVGKDTRYFGIDREDPLRDGLNSAAFQPGAEVWFRSPLNNGKTIREIGFGAPGLRVAPPLPQFGTPGVRPLSPQYGAPGLNPAPAPAPFGAPGGG